VKSPRRKAKPAATKTGTAEPRAGRKSGMVKVAAAAGLPFRERLAAFMFGEAAHLAKQCDAIKAILVFARDGLPDTPWGHSWKVKLQAKRDFLGEWLAHATAADLRILARWKARPDLFQPVDPVAFRLAQMAFTEGARQVSNAEGEPFIRDKAQGAWVKVAGKVEADRVWFEEPSSFLTRTPPKQQAAWVEKMENRTANRPPQPTPKTKAERLEAERLEAEDKERLRDRIRKTAEKLGAKRRPPGRPPENGTLLP